MAITEKREVKQVSVLPKASVVHVQWVDQIVKDGVVISEQYFRRAYSKHDAVAFCEAVENAAAYMQALGWTLDG